MDKMTTSEKRTHRREWINFCLQADVRLGIVTKPNVISRFVRQQEVVRYGKELRAYKSIGGWLSSIQTSNGE